MVEGIKRAYYDSNVWVAYMRGGRDRFFEACSPLFESVERGLGFVVVSHLAIEETIHALRRLTTDEFDPTSDSTEDHANIRSKCKSIEGRFAKYVNKLANNGNAEIANCPNTVFEHHSRVLSKISNYSGRITGGSNAKYRYAGLGHADIEHAYLASDAGVSAFYSTDKAFGGLNGDPEFAGVSFKVLR